MKNIELTEDYKSKLLEMCKILFPELNLEMYYDNDIADNWEEALKNDSCGNDAQTGYLISNWHKPNAKIIHWFEFCVIDLATKLYNLNKRDEICKIELYRGDLIQNYHPVEYLYEEYQYYLKTK